MARRFCLRTHQRMKAPFNNTTLSAFVIMTHRLSGVGAARVAGIHSVGATGYKQAFAVLKMQ